MEEWKDRSSRFEKSLKKTEEKLKEQISIGREVSIWVMCACITVRALWDHFGKVFVVLRFQTVLISIGVVDKYTAIFQGYKGWFQYAIAEQFSNDLTEKSRENIPLEQFSQLNQN